MMGAFLETRSQRVVDVTNPQPDDIHIEDIAHALGNLCRFGGHTRRFYSVAEHSVRVSKLVESAGASRIIQLQALLHDATEAYLVDMPSPIKRLLQEYYVLEQNLWRVIAAKYDVPFEMDEAVKEADARICINEKIALIGVKGLDGPAWLPLTSRYTPYHLGVSVSLHLGMKKPAHRFLERFYELTTPAWL